MTRLSRRVKPPKGANIITDPKMKRKYLKAAETTSLNGGREDYEFDEDERIHAHNVLFQGLYQDLREAHGNDPDRSTCGRWRTPWPPRPASVSRGKRRRPQARWHRGWRMRFPDRMNHTHDHCRGWRMRFPDITHGSTHTWCVSTSMCYVPPGSTTSAYTNPQSGLHGGRESQAICDLFEN